MPLGCTSWILVSSSSALRLPGLHVDFTTELVANLYSGGTFAFRGHPLDNNNQFHPDLRGFPRFRAYLGASSFLLTYLLSSLLSWLSLLFFFFRLSIFSNKFSKSSTPAEEPFSPTNLKLPKYLPTSVSFIAAI